MKPSQIIYFAVRRGLPSSSFRVEASPPRAKGLLAVKPLNSGVTLLLPGFFTFLNRTENLQQVDGSIDWLPIGTSRLWRYNLHYFDFLRQVDISNEAKNKLVKDWISNNPPGVEPAWEPYTCSLRIVNWVMWLDSEIDVDADDDVLNSLCSQICWLDKNTERHILANHYFENLKAIIFGTTLFPSDSMLAIRMRAIRELNLQLEEQFFEDGGHYERSPQYHCRMLENLLDLYNLCYKTSDRELHSLRRKLELRIEPALQWIRSICFPDLKVPLFGDTSLDGAPSLRELIHYSRKLGVDTNSALRSSCGEIALTKSGFYGIKTQQDMLIVTSSEASPAYQPGHAHCDMFSYELMLRGRRIVVDSGVGEYAPGARRDYVRSTVAHNTVTVDCAEQSECWGEFRLARRAKLLRAHSIRSSDGFHFEGLLKGFPSIPRGAVHRREVVVELTKTSGRICRVRIDDEVACRGEVSVQSYVHLHPDIAIERAGEGTMILRLNGEIWATIRYEQVLSVTEEVHEYCPNFGNYLPNNVIVFSKKSFSPVHISYEICAV